MKYINIDSQTFEGLIELYSKEDNKIFYTLSVQKGEKIFNISTLGKTLVTKNTMVGARVFYSNTRTYSEDQQKINEGRLTEYVDDTPVNYFLMGNTVNPSKIIFSMPSFSVGDLTKKYQVSKLNSLPSAEKQDVLIVALQDDYSVYGTYLTFDDEGNIISDKIHQFIKKIISDYKVEEENVLFFGVSKGGTLATLFGSHYPRAIIVNVVGHRNIKVMCYYSFKNLGAILNPLTKKDESFTRRNFEEFVTAAASGQNFYYIVGNTDAGTSDSFYYDYPNVKFFFVEGGHSAGIGQGKPIYFSVIREFLYGKYKDVKANAQLERFEASGAGHILQIALSEEGIDTIDTVSYVSFLTSDGKTSASTEIFKLTHDGKIKGFASAGFKPFDYFSMLPNLMNSIQVVTWSHKHKTRYIFKVASDPVIWRLSPKTKTIHSSATVLRAEFGTSGNKALLYIAPKDLWFARQSSELDITAYFINKYTHQLMGSYQIGNLGDNEIGRFFVNLDLKLEFIDNMNDLANCYINIEAKNAGLLINYILKVENPDGTPYVTPDFTLKKSHLVLLGDSITKYYHREMEYYTDSIVQDFGFPGISSAGLLKIIDNLPLKNYKNNKLVFMIGTNDLFNGLNYLEFRDNYRKLLSKLVNIFKKENIRILPILPISDNSFKNGESEMKTNQVIRQANEIIKELCDIFLIDFYVELPIFFADEQGCLKKEFTANGLHLNYPGRAELARRVVALIKEKE